jgi:hypothetical protein
MSTRCFPDVFLLAFAVAASMLHFTPLLVFLPDGTVESMSANICAYRVQRSDDISPSNFQLE